MVIDFAVDSQYPFPVRRIEGLPTRFRVNNAQSFMSQNGPLVFLSRCPFVRRDIDTTPVRTAVAYFLTHLQCLLAQFSRLMPNV